MRGNPGRGWGRGICPPGDQACVEAAATVWTPRWTAGIAGERKGAVTVTDSQSPPETCGLCERILNAHCELHGRQEPTFCELLERHHRDPTYGPDEVLVDLVRVATPAQMEQVREHLSLGVGQAPSPGA